MSYIKYNFNDDNCKIYKGIKYYKFSDCYIIISQNGTKYTRYSVKDVKECINNYIINNIK